MLIATFGPSTGWLGKTITFENNTFVLQDHGPITASDVMHYDEQGHLEWANDGTRAWVGSFADRSGKPAAAYSKPEALRASTARLSTISAGKTRSPWNQRVTKWHLVFVVVVVVIGLCVMWPRHHTPPWNVVATIQNAPACPHPLSNLTAADTQYMSFSGTFTVANDTMVQLFAAATNDISDVTVSGFIVPASVPQDANDIGNNLSECRSFAYSTEGSMYDYEVMPAGTYYVAGMANGHSWNLFASTQ